MTFLVPAYQSRPRRLAALALYLLALTGFLLALDCTPASAQSSNYPGIDILRDEALQAGIFGAPETAVGRPEDIRQWNDFKRRYIGEKDLLDKCVADAASCASPRARDWSRFLVSQENRPREDQVEAI